ncbi:MAG TPA: hypothetical protein VGY55_24580 [Pirellulales bacterium]|nr:hypothetical protein [Pirellulales bacterium]
MPISAAAASWQAPVPNVFVDVQWDYSDSMSAPVAAPAPSPFVAPPNQFTNLASDRDSRGGANGVVQATFEAPADAHGDDRGRAIGGPPPETTFRSIQPTVVAAAKQTTLGAPFNDAPNRQSDSSPPVLKSPTELPPPWDDLPVEPIVPGTLLRYPEPPPLGFTGRSGVLPREGQSTSDFVPLEDRWRLGFTPWDRYGKGHPLIDDYPYVEGDRWDSYNQNVLKGDYPIIGQHTFLNITAVSDTQLETRQVPTPSGESTANPGESEFFGNPNQFVFQENLSVSFDLVHGDSSFKPVDWRLKLTPIFNVNFLDVEELGVVSPDVTRGHTRGRTWFTLQEWFAETKLADLSPNYDFVSLRAGSQPFNSDFRGFIFDDTNRAVRLFGTRLSNRDQFNVAFFDQLEKDTNSDLNTFDDRGQKVLIANYYRQDFIWPGYTTQLSIHYNHDDASLHYDKNGFLVRPDPVGIFQPHTIDACYLGWAGDGHINRLNVDHAFYWVFGQDSLNPMAGQPERISAEMAAVELSYDSDWIRFRSSIFYASGDSNPFDTEAHGFDTILDDPNFAGGPFSYWQRQPIKLLGVNLKQPFSLVPDLRSSKTEGQSNFVNPGVFIANLGMDFEVTPKLKVISNVNFLWFDETAVIEQFVFQPNIHQSIGTDLGLGFEYRPWLNNNCIIDTGIQSLIPGQGFEDIYRTQAGRIGALFASFLDVKLLY